MIKSLTEVKIMRAVDDQGQTGAIACRNQLLSPARCAGAVMEDPRLSGVNFSLRLALPEPDAQSIEEIEGEAIALTLGDWKSVTLTNLQADPKKEIDLGELVPGAKIVIRKVETKNRQSVEARVEGPVEIRLLDFRLVAGERKVRGIQFLGSARHGDGGQTSHGN